MAFFRDPRSLDVFAFRLKFALKVTHPVRKTPTSTDFRL